MAIAGDLSFELPELAAELMAARTAEALEAALAKVAQLTPRIREPENYGRRLFTPGLDAGLMRVARALQLTVTPPPKSNAKVAIVASQFYATGGHTRVARDVAAALGPDNRPLLILSNLGDGSVRYQGLLNSGLKTPFDEAAVLIAQAPTLVERIVELFMMLKASGVSRIVLMCHPYDVAAITACWAFRDIVDFVHHADHVPALGASMAWSTHADPTYACHKTCRAAGLDAIYAGMTSTVTEAPPHVREPGRLRLATCGDERKYVGEGRHRWADWAVAALSLPGAEMRHIGIMSEPLQREVHKALADAGIDPARYIFAGMAPSLPAALIEHGTDIYVGSYPFGGGKANLEAMLLGLPMIAPADADLANLLRFDLPLPGWVDVAEPKDFAAAVEQALALEPVLASPDHARLREREITRFARWVAGERPDAA
ncbi:MAG: glycosyltransferase [Proteobacteria bacterium]|nr:glycosyltransferase [Pseudomonadota bacterium]